jgi:transposase
VIFQTGSQHILLAIRKRRPWIKHLFADGAYDRRKLMDKAAFNDFVLEIVRRIDNNPGFKVLPRRWVVERTFGWMTRWRRLVRAYEKRIDVSKAMSMSQWAAYSCVGSLTEFSNGL